MMRITSLPRVNDLQRERNRLFALKAEVENDRLQVVIRSEHQDDAMVALVVPVIARELAARLCRVAAELKTLGVELT